MTDITRNIKNLLSNIAEVCKANNIDSNHIKIMAVSKYHSTEKIKIAYDNGLRLFGENKVQEYESKYDDFKKHCKDAKMYLTGNLQSNKVKKAVDLFDGIMSINSIKLANKINSHARDINKKIIAYIQINIANEQQKNGVSLNDFESLYNEIKTMKNIILQGIMCIPPAKENPREYFLQMNEIKQKYKLKEVSQGMSQDYQQAITCGTNMLRIGSAIFVS